MNYAHPLNFKHICLDEMNKHDVLLCKAYLTKKRKKKFFKKLRTELQDHDKSKILSLLNDEEDKQK